LERRARKAACAAGSRRARPARRIIATSGLVVIARA
jgi:hypothetical protein